MGRLVSHGHLGKLKACWTWDVGETVLELFEGNTERESTNKASDARKENETPRCGIEIVTHREIQERNRERISKNTRKTTACDTRVWDEWAQERNSLLGV